MHDFLAGAGFAAITILAFEVAMLVSQRIGHPASNPTLFTILGLIALLTVFHIPYAAYMEGGAPISWLLGPATVALGGPLARNLGNILRDRRPVMLALLAGTITAALTGPIVLALLGGSQTLELAMAPKAATTPIAIKVAHEIGGQPSLAAVFAIAGGVTVAIVIRPLLRWLRVEDHRAFGLAAGVAGSGIGAAEAVARDPVAGAYAALGVGLTAIATALIVPVLVAFKLV
jgi:putative effector of murein hydrolase